MGLYCVEFQAFLCAFSTSITASSFKVITRFFSVSEFHPSQPVLAQQVCAGAERGHGQVQLVDHQPGRKDWRQILAQTRF